MATIETRPAPELSPAGEDAWRREQRAFHAMLPELLRTHPGLFVAVHGGRVVEAGADKVEVARRAYARCGYVPVFVSRVVAGPATPVRVPSPRGLDGPTP